MKVSLKISIIQFLAFTGCGSSHDCRNWASTVCSADRTMTDSGGGFQTEFIKMSIDYHRITKKSASNGCEKDYLEIFPFAETASCIYQKNGVVQTTSLKMEDVDGNRIYSCLNANGETFIKFKRGEANGTYTLFGSSQVFLCTSHSQVDEIKEF